ncbi:hypothetical protein J3A83DRAFT_4185942 [Scleroderma citrinum]
MAIGFALYGASIGQYLFYIRFFPDDHYILKSAAFIVLYAILLFSHHTNTLTILEQQLSVTLVTNVLSSKCTVAFCVQCFYAHRVWIMSARNKLLICAVLTCSCAQLVSLLISKIQVLLAEGNSTHNITTLFDTWFGAFDGISCAVCDAIITISVFIYLRPLRNSPVRFNFLFVQMGLITLNPITGCLLIIDFSVTTLMVAILYDPVLTSGKYLTATPGAILSKTYTNSMLALLNARKQIRDRERANPSAVEIPTLATIR